MSKGVHARLRKNPLKQCMCPGLVNAAMSDKTLQYLQCSAYCALVVTLHQWQMQQVRIEAVVLQLATGN